MLCLKSIPVDTYGSHLFIFKCCEHPCDHSFNKPLRAPEIFLQQFCWLGTQQWRKQNMDIVYCIFLSLPDIRFHHDKQSFGEYPCTGFPLQVFLWPIFLGVEMHVPRPHFQLYHVLTTCFLKCCIRSGPASWAKSLFHSFCPASG